VTQTTNTNTGGQDWLLNIEPTLINTKKLYRPFYHVRIVLQVKTKVTRPPNFFLVSDPSPPSSLFTSSSNFVNEPIQLKFKISSSGLRSQEDHPPCQYPVTFGSSKEDESRRICVGFNLLVLTSIVFQSRTTLLLFITVLMTVAGYR
jgi:hypothetical protein